MPHWRNVGSKPQQKKSGEIDVDRVFSEMTTVYAMARPDILSSGYSIFRPGGPSFNCRGTVRAGRTLRSSYDIAGLMWSLVPWEVR